MQINSIDNAAIIQNNKITYCSIIYRHNAFGIFTDVELFYKVKDWKFKVLSWEISRSEFNEVILKALQDNDYFEYIESFYNFVNISIENLEKN